MRLLIDTHVILWFQSSDTKLTVKVRELITNRSNECYVSIASLWEMAIKISLGKLRLDLDFKSFPEYLLDNQFNLLAIEPNHLSRLLSLPDHHNDPFDRLLISQAIAENLTIISADRHFQSYPVNVSW